MQLPTRRLHKTSILRANRMGGHASRPHCITTIIWPKDPDRRRGWRLGSALSNLAAIHYAATFFLTRGGFGSYVRGKDGAACGSWTGSSPRPHDGGSRRRPSTAIPPGSARSRFCRTPDGQWQAPARLGAGDVERFLNDIALRRRLSASAQNQAVNAIVFLYKQVLVDELGPEHLGRFCAERARRPVRVPTVLSAAEAIRGRVG